MSVTAVLLTAEVRPTAGGSGETPLQGLKSVVVSAMSTPGSGAHSAWAALSTQRRGPGEEASFVIPASMDRVKRQPTGPPSASCSPKPSEGSRAQASGGTGPVGATCPRCGPRSARAALGPSRPRAGHWPEGGWSRQTQAGPCGPLWFLPSLLPSAVHDRPPAHWRPLCILSCGFRSMDPYLSTNSIADTARGLQPLAPSLYFGENVNVKYI